MAKTAADVMVDVLYDWGVRVVFGLPGDGINGIMEALRKRSKDIRFVQVRHEESAAFMACAYAKYTGKLGVCLGTSGPGGIHLLNGLYDAKLDGQPVLAITGHHYHDLIDTFSQQDVDLDRVFMDVAVYSTRVMGKAHVENVTNLACRLALSRRGVSHINFPVDTQEQEQDRHSMHDVEHHMHAVRAHRASIPSDEDLHRAAMVLDKGSKIAILAGRGALGASDVLETAAEKFQAPVIKALLGKAALPDDSPYTTGSIGYLGTRPSQDAMEDCDTLFIIGSSFPYAEFLPRPGRARAVQIDSDPARIGLRYPVEVGLIGDARETLQRLLPLCKGNSSHGFLRHAQKGMKDWNALMAERASRSTMPMKPQVVAHELGTRLQNDAIISCDSGTITTWFARHIAIKKGQMASLSGTLATMACGLPYAIAAGIAFPNRQSIAFVGDGGFTMLMGEFVTAVKYRIPVKVFILKNNSLGQIKWEQMVFLGNPEYGCELEPIDFAAYARACGGTGFHLERPEACGAIIEEALKTPGPVVVEAVVDPYEPPMPAKVSLRQAAHLAESLIKGEPNRDKIAATIAADKVREMI